MINFKTAKKQVQVVIKQPFGGDCLIKTERNRFVQILLSLLLKAVHCAWARSSITVRLVVEDIPEDYFMEQQSFSNTLDPLDFNCLLKFEVSYISNNASNEDGNLSIEAVKVNENSMAADRNLLHESHLGV